jgi:hypothetical protein
MDNAAGAGLLDVVEFLHTHRTEGCSTKALDLASTNGHVDVVRFLVENRSEGNIQSAFSKAGENGRLDVLKYLETHLAKVPHSTNYNSIFRLAAWNGHLQVVEYLHENFGPFSDPSQNYLTAPAINEAAVEGHLPVIQFLFKHYESFFSAFTYKNVLRDGSPDQQIEEGAISVLQFLIQNHPECQKHALVITAFSRPSLVPIIHGPTCTDMCHPAVLDFAARARDDDVETVKFLNENCRAGCTFRALQRAKRSSNVAIAEYLDGVPAREMDEQEYREGVIAWLSIA